VVACTIERDHDASILCGLRMLQQKLSWLRSQIL